MPPAVPTQGSESALRDVERALNIPLTTRALRRLCVSAAGRVGYPPTRWFVGLTRVLAEPDDIHGNLLFYVKEL